MLDGSVPHPRKLPAERLVPAACLLALVVLSLAGLHGFSLPAWHDKIDGSPSPEVLAGTAQGIRSDDWAVSLPLIFSQSAQEHPFAPTSDLVGYGGVDMRVGSPVPIRGFLALFRPQLWGYFAGRDVGMAWHWWFRILALFCASFLAFVRLARGRALLALAGAAAFSAAPFFVFWSYNCEPLVAMAMLAFVALTGIASTSTPRAIALHGVLLAWSAGCFALSFLYPPYQVALAWSLAACTLGWAWRERASLRIAPRRGTRIAVASLALGVAAACVAIFLAQSREAIALVSQTIYPGARMSYGGDVSFLQLAQNYFTVPAGKPALDAFGNVCEAGAFFFLMPILGAAYLWEAIARRRRPDPLAAVFLVLAALFVVYACLGLPRPLASFLFLGRVPGLRTVPALGWIDFALLMAYFASPPELTRRARWIVAGGCTAALLGVGIAVAAHTGGLTSWLVAPVTAAFLALALALLRQKTAAVVVLAAASIAATCWFNPVVRGGSDYLLSNSFSKTVLELDRAGGGHTRWLVYEQPSLADLFRAIGVRAVNGVHFYPQHELWSRLGLQARPDIWNRYAHIAFELPERPDEARLQLRSLDAVVVRLHPDHPAFARLDLDYVVWVGADPERLSGIRALRKVASVGDKHIFKVILPGSPPL